MVRTLRNCDDSLVLYVEDYLKDNPGIWIERIKSAVDTVPNLGPMVDTSKIAVLGFSEGGSPAIQLARTDIQVKYLILYSKVCSSKEHTFLSQRAIMFLDCPFSPDSWGC